MQEIPQQFSFIAVPFAVAEKNDLVSKREKVADPVEVGLVFRYFLALPGDACW
ncbi:hypothetical protein [Edaphobacter aggregans]|uniref:hypothetical protein n=1 Tax=Edaphobacter aggregans TaxID=570835 RepID=UPI0012FC1BC7|nr:hypothetical protein [Edaphobacter aggregans]